MALPDRHDLLRTFSRADFALLALLVPALLAVAAYEAPDEGGQGAGMLQEAEAHTGTIYVTNARLINSNTILVTYSGGIPAPQSRQVPQSVCYGFGNCAFTGYKTVWNTAAQYSDVVMNPGGAMGIRTATYHAYNAHLIHLSGSVPSADATGSFSVASSGSARWTGSHHIHTRDAATVTVSDGQGPGLAAGASPSLDLVTGALSFSLNEPLNKQSTDPSKITISGVNLSGAAVTTAGTDRTVTIELTEAQRSGIAATQDADGGLAADLAAGAFVDARGNWSGPASGVSLSVTKDTVPPSLQVADSGLDLGTGVLTLSFSEYVDVSEADMSGVRLQDADGSTSLSLAGNPVLGDSDGQIVQVQLTDLQRAQVVNPAAFPPGRPAEMSAYAGLPVIKNVKASDMLTGLTVPSTAFRDSAGIHLSQAVSGAAVPVKDDAVAPSVLASPRPVLALDTGALSLEFDEYVDARAADLQGVSISDQVGGSVALGSSGLSSDGKAVILELPAPDWQRVIDMRTDLSLSVTAAAFKDVSGNPAEGAEIGIDVRRDRLSPSLLRASLDPGTGELALVFSETVDATPAGQVDLSKMSMRAPQTAEADAVRLSSGSDRATVTSTSDGPRVDITLTESQRSSLAAGQSRTLLLAFETGAVHDLSRNHIGPASQLRVDTELDLSGPTALSAALDAGTGELTVTFDETVDATPASQVDVSRFYMRDSGGGADARPTSLGSAAVDEFDRTSLTVTLTEEQRQAALSYSAAPLLDIAAGAVSDAAGNPAGAASGVAVSVSGTDTAVPSLRSAYLDQGTGRMTLLFTETVDASSLDLSKLTIQEEELIIEAPENTGRVCFQTLGGQYVWDDTGLPCTPAPARQAAPQASVALSTSTHSASVLTEADGLSLVVALTEEQLLAVAAFGRAAQLDVAQGAVADTSANPIQARSDVALTVQADVSAPTMDSARVSGPGSVTARFSEDLLDSSVEAADFAVRGHRIAGVEETKGTVVIELSTRIDNESGRTVRVSMTGSVSDTEGNVLNGAISAVYADAPNDLTFADADSFTVSSDNANPAYARSGDTITVEFAANVDILPASETWVTFNGSPAASVSGITARGFTAAYTVQASDADGPVGIAAAVATSDAVSVFSEADLTSGPNVTIDMTPPEYLSASLAGTKSIHVHYSERVETAASDYASIKVMCDGCTAQPATSAVSPGPSSHVLVSWGTAVPGTTHAHVEFSVGPGVTDLAGNALSNPGTKTMDPPGNLEALSRLQLDATPDGVSGVALSPDTLVHTVVAPPGTVPVIDVSSFDEPDSAPPELAGAANRIQFPEGRELTVDTERGTVTFPPSTQAGGFPDPDGADTGRTITVDVSQKSPDSAFMEMHPHVDPEFSLILEFGRPDVDLVFSLPVRVGLKSDVLPDSTVFTIDAAGSTRQVLACGPGVTDSSTANAFILASIAPLASPTVDGAACVDADFNVIWTKHFSAFGVSVPAPAPGGSRCDDCTPPTIGRDEGGALVVAGGFEYNGRQVNVETFFTPYPRIEAAVGSPNVAALKIYENGGPDNVQHAALAFGLRSGQVISESVAVVSWDRGAGGDHSVSLVDPHNAIDEATLRVEASEVQCADGSSLECLFLEFHHTFRAPLEFDIVGTDVWDTGRNAWQNYFNHGVHVTGESLNEEPGVLVGGVMLYPIREGSGHALVMSDGAGQLYRLAPDGEYRQLTNSSALYREIDESMWIQADPAAVPMGGYDRHDPRFGDALAVEELEALGVLASLTRSAPLQNPEFGAPADLVYHEQGYGDRSADEGLRADILSERERAALLYEAMFANRR